MCVCMYLQCAQLTWRPQDAAQTSPESGGHAGHVGQPTAPRALSLGSLRRSPGCSPGPEPVGLDSWRGAGSLPRGRNAEAEAALRVTARSLLTLNVRVYR